ncbi:hypothetical protein TNCV_2916611 [Trichonephila clavipes]|nr:hypothetical protein TNCV_2916611 [Trichonephila clavipes]
MIVEDGFYRGEHITGPGYLEYQTQDTVSKRESSEAGTLAFLLKTQSAEKCLTDLADLEDVQPLPASKGMRKESRTLTVKDYSEDSNVCTDFTVLISSFESGR